MKPTKDVHFICHVISDKIILATICIIHRITIQLYPFDCWTDSLRTKILAHKMGALNSAPIGRSTHNCLSYRYQHFPADPRPTTIYSIHETCFINSVANIFNKRRLKILSLLSTTQIIRQSPWPFVTFLKYWFSL